MGLSMQSSCVNCDSNIQADIKTIRSLVLAVLDDRCMNSVTDICDLILKKYGSIPYENWSILVKNILITESEKSESCISSTLYKNEQVFGLVENVEKWFLLRQNCRDTSNAKLQISATIKKGVLVDFNPHSPNVPPGMSTEKARIIACGLASMNCLARGYESIDALLEIPDTKKLNYARDAWSLSRYNDRLKGFIFYVFRKLVDEDEVWTNVVLEVVCGHPWRPHSENEPLNDSSESFCSIPPGMSIKVVAYLVLMVIIMNEAPYDGKISASFLTMGDYATPEEERIPSLRKLLLYNPTLSELIQPVVDRFSNFPYRVKYNG